VHADSKKMTITPKISRFAKYAWFVLAYNIVVILWGVFLRASKSGDGCGQHWVTCHGEFIPSAPELKTIIEFSHRVTSSIAGLLLIVLLIWAIRRWYVSRSNQNRYAMVAAIGSFIFVVIEGLLGRSLVLTGNTAMTLTPERPFWMAGHLVNTFILLAFITLTGWFATHGRRLNFRLETKYIAIVIFGMFVIIAVGVSGSIAALASMLFPAETIGVGIDQDFSPTSNVLLRLRLLHPILSVITGVFVIFISGWLKRESDDDKNVKRWSGILSGLIVVQLGFGAATLLSLAPIVMQLGHLFLADAIWISFVLTAANFMAARPSGSITDSKNDLV